MRIAIFIILLSFFLNVNAQTGPKVFELEYDQSGQSVEAYGFTIHKCSNIAIEKSWEDWIKGKNGKINILKKHEASQVMFKNVSDAYKLVFNLVEVGTDSVTIVNSFMDNNGMYLATSNPDYPQILENLYDLSFEVRKSCELAELVQANQYLVKLNNQLNAAQKEENKSTQDVLKKQNTILDLEKKKNTYADQIANLQSAIDNSGEDQKLDKYIASKNKTETKFYETEEKISKLGDEISGIKIAQEQATANIIALKEQINNQNSLIEKLKVNLNSIYR